MSIDPREALVIGQKAFQASSGVGGLVSDTDSLLQSLAIAEDFPSDENESEELKQLKVVVNTLFTAQQDLNTIARSLTSKAEQENEE